MTGQEVRTKIDYNNNKIKELLSIDTFVLNTKVKKLLEENTELQKQCNHYFKNGRCIYCDVEDTIIP